MGVAVGTGGRYRMLPGRMVVLSRQFAWMMAVVVVL
jgi:hypothetical protein